MSKGEYKQVKAKDYLQRVLQLFPSTEAGNTLEKIRKLEAEIK